MNNELLIKFLRCETSPEEEVLIADWLDADSENQKELDTMQLLMEGLALCSPELNRMNAQKTSRRVFMLTRFSRIAVAVSIAAFIAMGFIYNHYSNQLSDFSNQKTLVEVPSGQRINLTLSDGTSVWLDAGAQLEYPSAFSGKERRVKISGQVMFDVEHDAKHPFVVETFACDIEVLGTKFNIEANESSNYFSAALMEGSIKLSNRIEPGDPIIMRVNDEVKLVDGALQLSQINNHDEFLWPDGIISIQDMEFRELMVRFERIFDIKIEIQRREMPSIQYGRGKIRVSDGIDHALSVLQMSSNFTYKKDSESGKITIQ